ncbi:Uncharacterised protein [Vibrio vulnificus]|nr:Uncharacterised protein [Vibrio vulnificus]
MKKRTLLCSALLAAIAANGLFSSPTVLANTSTQAETGLVSRFSTGDHLFCFP